MKRGRGPISRGVTARGLPRDASTPGRKPHVVLRPGEIHRLLARGVSVRKTLSASFAVAYERALQSPSKGSALLALRQWAEDELRDQRVRVTRDRKAEALALARTRGLGVASIASRVGLSAPSVRRILFDAGVILTVEKGPGRSVKASRAEVEKALGVGSFSGKP